MKKNLVIMTGVTGAIGNAFLAEYATYLEIDEMIVYGLSRKAYDIKQFIEESKGLLYPKTFIANIGEYTAENIEKFISLLPVDDIASISYVHAVGLYPFEVDEGGNHAVQNDKDNDGINDEVFELTYRLFKDMTTIIAHWALKKKKFFSALILGGIADIHKPLAHESWWKTIEKTKQFMSVVASRKHVAMHVLNISSVICSHEVITRPFVFIGTDANPRYWLSPQRVAKEIREKILGRVNGFSETSLFHESPYYHKDYYKHNHFTRRKVNELYK